MKTIVSILALLTAVAYAADAPTPNSATKDAAFVNSLGMKFVPVEITGGPTNGKRVLFSIWDTRVKDYAKYARANGIKPEKPDFKQGPTHPVVMVSWDDSKSFCAWLTDKERVSGRIGSQDGYRLPSDHEWSCAVGIGKLEKPQDSPRSKHCKIFEVFPWGRHWPPPKGAGNYADSTLGKLNTGVECIHGYHDGFAFTSPVGSFTPNPSGLCDMGGNVYQWCEDWYDAKHLHRVARGGAWNDEDYFDLFSASRGNRGWPIHPRVGDYGFRCVLQVADNQK